MGTQNDWIAAFLIIGFVVFITLRGELASYLSVLGIGGGGSTSASSSSLLSQAEQSLSGALNQPVTPSTNPFGNVTF